MAGQLEPTGIIDIGSNSVRFVAFGGSARVPSHLFNEKIAAALGRGLEVDGRLDTESMGRTLAALARFRQLAKAMRLKRVHTVATAAVRDAANGREFLADIAALGLDPRVLPGAEEAELAGLGVISSIPGARGIVADLGGGSLELVAVADGAVGARVSLPIGVLRVGSKANRKALSRLIKDAVAGSSLVDAAHDAGLYLVGGSFRSIARLDLHEQRHPLPIIHQHALTPEGLERVDSLVATLSAADIKARTGISANRVFAYPAARAILDSLRTVLQPEAIVTCAFGLREGLLYRALAKPVRAEDPLLAAALEVGETLGRFGDHGTTIDRWIDPLFPDDGANARRLRLTACLMSDYGWNAHPDFRAERAVDMALHGNWTGIDAHGRALLGRTLCAAFAGEQGLPAGVASLFDAREEKQAIAWGKAIRLAQRLSGGTESILLKSGLSLEDGQVTLSLPRGQRALAGETVERRLRSLASALGADHAIEAA